MHPLQRPRGEYEYCTGKPWNMLDFSKALSSASSRPMSAERVTTLPLDEYIRITPEQELGHPALQAQHICGAAASDMSTPCSGLSNRPPAPRSPFAKLCH